MSGTLYASLFVFERGDDSYLLGDSITDVKFDPDELFGGGEDNDMELEVRE